MRTSGCNAFFIIIIVEYRHGELDIQIDKQEIQQLDNDLREAWPEGGMKCEARWNQDLCNFYFLLFLLSNCSR
jgi:hypothetical protein